MLKKTLIILLAFLIAISSVACVVKEAGNQGQTKTNGEEVVSDVSRERVKIVVMTSEFVNAPLTGDQLTFQEIGKRLNVEFEFRVTPSGQYNEKLDLALSAGDLPDLASVSRGRIINKICRWRRIFRT